MATLTECRNRHSSSISHGGLIGELCSYESVQLHKSSWQQEAGEKPSGRIKLAPGLYLAGASNPDKGVMRFSFFEQSKLNVASDDVAQMGVGRHLAWVWPVAEVALFEGRSPQDPEYPKLKAVGVYPVVDGWAHVNLEELAGKGQDYFSPLYIVAGSALMKSLGLGLERRLNSLNLVKPTAQGKEQTEA